MENNNVQEIVPAEGNEGLQAFELAEAAAGGENKSGAETTALTVVAADEQEVTPPLTVVADEQQPGTMALTVASGGGEMTVASGGGEVTVAGGGGEVTVASGGGDVTVVGDEQQGTMAVTVGSGGGVVTVASCGGGEGRAKKQRGRPRKEGEELMGMIEFSPTQKRGRGRPKGTGKLQRLARVASFGDGNAGEIGGSNFIPRIMIVQKGENIVERIRSFCEATSDAVCIISACGSVSIADLYASVPRPGILRYEGDLSIVTLCGSHTYTNNRSGKVLVMSVQLAYPDSHLCGGAVAASLIAASPIQIMMGTFKQDIWPQHKSTGTSTSANPAGMRLVAIAERVDSDQPVLAQPISSAQI